LIVLNNTDSCAIVRELFGFTTSFTFALVQRHRYDVRREEIQHFVGGLHFLEVGQAVPNGILFARVVVAPEYAKVRWLLSALVAQIVQKAA